MPSRAMLDPIDIPSLLQYIVLTDVIDGGKRYRYRLVGTDFVRNFGYDPTGKYLDEAIEDPGFMDYIHSICCEILETKRPSYFEIDFSAVDPTRYRKIERLILPLSSDGNSVDMLIGAHIFGGIQSQDGNWFSESKNRFFVRNRVDF